MKAWVIERITPIKDDLAPLKMIELPVPQPGADQILIKVETCGVCHTEIDEIEGRAAPPLLPMVPGHQVVGQVVERGKLAQKFQIGDWVGVAWIYAACGRCTFCLRGEENLCGEFKATGRDEKFYLLPFVILSKCRDKRSKNRSLFPPSLLP